MKADDGVRERARVRMHLLVRALLVGLIFFELNYIGFRHSARLDWTDEARFTLSERSIAELRELSRDVVFYVFVGRNEQQFADVRELLEQYRSHSQHISVEYTDLDMEGQKARELAERFHLVLSAAETGETLADVAIVVASGDRHWKVSRDDFFSLDEEDEGSLSIQSEQALTGALLRVRSGTERLICFATGHGEWEPEAAAEIAMFKETAQRENIAFETLQSAPLRQIPSRCSVVAVFAPDRPWEERDARALIDYARAGGAVWLALDPTLARGAVAPTGFEEALLELGILVDRDVVLELDEAMLLRRDPSDVWRVARFGEHPLLRGLRDGATMAVRFARSVRAEQESAASPLLSASASAYGETDLSSLSEESDLVADGLDVASVEGALPLPLGVAWESPVSAGDPATDTSERRGRIIVMGDSDWLTSAFLAEPAFANLDLLVGSLSLLTERGELVALPARRERSSGLSMSQSDLSGVAYRIFLFLPAAIALLGAAAVLSRRK